MMIVTDTASDILEEEAQEMGIRLVQLDVLFGEDHCGSNTTQAFNDFYRMLTTREDFPMTSQPSPDSYLKLFKEAQEADEDVLVICLTSTISGTAVTARMTADMSGHGDRIVVMDSRQAIVSQRILTEYAVKLRNEGKSLEEMVPLLESFRDRIQICGILDTLTYLQKGGRIPKPLAAVGNMLKIKPIVAVEDGNLTSPVKARGMKAAKKAIWKRLASAKLDPEWPVHFIYTSDRSMAEEFLPETQEQFDLPGTKITQIGSVVGAHLGPSAFGFAYVEAE